MRTSPFEVDLSFRDTSLWFQGLHLERDQIPPARLSWLGMLPEMLASRFPVIWTGEGC